MSDEPKTALEYLNMEREIVMYIKELEKENESLGEKLQKAIDRWVNFRTKCYKLEKALDKACLILENIDNRCAYFEKEYYKAIGKEVSEELEVNTKEEWREVFER